MREREAQIVTAHGHMATHVVFPRSAARLPAVVLFMDAPGIREELLAAARRIARAGFYCAVPDLYYRYGRIRLDLTRRTEAHAEVYRALSAGLGNGMVASDTASLLAFLGGESQVREGPVGCLGFSIGGRFAVQAAGLFPNQVLAAAAVCGTGIVTDKDDSPHTTLRRAQAELLFEFAEHDAQVPAQVIPSLKTVLDGAAKRYGINVEPGTSHGYTFPMRPVYHAVGAENTWRRVLDLFARAFKPEAHLNLTGR
jgi:carboxymethylenebutenolidase